MVSTVLASFFLFCIPYAIKSAVDIVLAQAETVPVPFFQAVLESGLAERGFVGKLFFVAFFLLVMTLLASLFTYLHGRLASLSAETVARKLRNRLYDRIQRMPCTALDEMETGDLVQRCTSDVETVRVFLDEHLTTIARSTVTVAVAVALMLPLGVEMTIASTLLLPIVILFSLLYFSKVRGCFQEVDEAEAAMTAAIQENLSGIRVVRAFSNQQLEISRFGVKNDAYRDRWFRLISIMSAYWSVSNLLVFGQRGICLAVGGWMLATSGFGPGDFMAFLVFVSLVLWPIQRLGRVMADMGKASVSLSRISGILDAPVETDPPEARELTSATGRLEFRDLSFVHGSGKAVLKGVSITIQPGETLAIIGPSGSGKTTLIDLLLRFYDFDEGAIFLDGIDIRRIRRTSLRSSIGVVRQSPFLFSRSVRENILLARSSANEEEIHHASEVAALHETVKDFDAGYDTVVGEKGVTLSGGQRQRVALAREVLRDPPVLVLDDGLSAVDAATETEICNALESRKGRKTTIVIAHRFSTLRLADRIVVLEDGAVTQAGGHAELVSEEGLYKKLWRIQCDIENELPDPGTREGGAQ